jgi:DNA topoisomerase-6 subunit A
MAKGSSGKKRAAGGAAAAPRAPSEKMLVNVRKSIKDEAESLYTKIIKQKRPMLRFPLRSLTNVNYTPVKGFFELGKKEIERTLTVNTVKTFAQTLRMMALSKELVETDDIATKREAYYVSKNWEEARFDEQPESDAIMEDVEALFRVNRE